MVSDYAEDIIKSEERKKLRERLGLGNRVLSIKGYFYQGEERGEKYNLTGYLPVGIVDVRSGGIMKVPRPYGVQEVLPSLILSDNLMSLRTRLLNPQIQELTGGYIAYSLRRMVGNFWEGEWRSSRMINGKRTRGDLSVKIEPILSSTERLLEEVRVRLESEATKGVIRLEEKEKLINHPGKRMRGA